MLRGTKVQGDDRRAAVRAEGGWQTMATDLENFLAADGRDGQVKDVRRQIDAAGITYIYYQFVSVTGRIMGKGVPAKHWESMAGKGFQLVYGSTANLFVDRHGDYIGYGPEAHELVGLPEPDTFMPLPWDSKVARVWCQCFRNREELGDPGAFLTSDCRGNLKRIQADFEQATGLHLRAGTEPEMMWLKLKPDGTPDVDGVTKPFCYHIDQFSELQPIIHKMVEYGEAMGLDMIQGDHEDAPGQIELNFNFDRALQTADNLSTFRQIAKQVGRELKVFPCFMPKPFMGVSANGCHHNISLWRGEENVFLPETDDQRLPSQIGLYAIGGILEHLGALTAVTASTVNSYRRLWDTGFWAPVFADWGFQNRTTALRVSAPGRFEYRSVDSAVNPYLSMAALIAAMRDGIERKLDPGEPEERNIYEALSGGKQVKKIPMTFGDALDALDADEVIKSAMPGDMYTVFRHYKRDEWERYCSTVSDWDVKEYLDVLP
jgi:glutamine synthetase